MNPEAAAFFVSLLNGATQAHLLHFKSKSYSEHIALGSLYEELPRLTDTLVEAYQGINGVIEMYPRQTLAVSSDAIKFAEILRAFVANNRQSVGADPELQNIVDEILALIDSTTYKLVNLK
jgi:hypothetical protein